jgi:hypothetical protein
MDNDMEHLEYLNKIVENDVDIILRKESTYKGSWKKRGGEGAFFVTARKWDRLEEIVKLVKYDIFAALDADPFGADGSALAEVRDLRRYLLLIEAEMRARWATNNFVHGEPGERGERGQRGDIGTPEDGGHHARQQENEIEPIKVLERLQDGLKEIPRAHEDWYMTSVSNGAGYHIVNRNKVDKGLWEHLPLMRIELNDKEYREALRPEYQSLYSWNESDTKWQMRKQYQEHWGKS